MSAGFPKRHSLLPPSAKFDDSSFVPAKFIFAGKLSPQLPGQIGIGQGFPDTRRQWALATLTENRKNR
jgi:hypothetical protein